MTPFRVACYAQDGTYRGLVSPFQLKLATLESAETIAARYNAIYPARRYAGVEINAAGDIVSHPDWAKLREYGA